MIPMVDLKNQYLQIKDEIDEAILSVVASTRYIKGPQVAEFEKDLSHYLQIKHVISCGNGTDALQIALMALGLEQGDEVICPAFTYVATAEVIGLLGLKPVMVDVDPNTFTMRVEDMQHVVTEKTKAVVPVHLYGQSCDMEPILDFAKEKGLFVIEDNAQALGASYQFSDGRIKKTGTMGDIGCTSFFPSKNLGCYGDGGALMTDDDALKDKISMIANHGQRIKYHHDVLGCNSRLDTIQAAILDVKLMHLERYGESRGVMAREYNRHLAGLNEIILPTKRENSTHVFHQFTIRVKNGKRDALQAYLKEEGIPSMIYYPLPLYKQKAFKPYVEKDFELPNTERLCEEVLSLPIHTEINLKNIEKTCQSIIRFFKDNK